MAGLLILFSVFFISFPMTKIVCEMTLCSGLQQGAGVYHGQIWLSLLNTRLFILEQDSRKGLWLTSLGTGRWLGEAVVMFLTLPPNGHIRTLNQRYGGIETSKTEQGNWNKEPVKSSNLFLTPNQSADTDCSTASESSWWECMKLAQLLWKMCGAVPWGSHKWIESYLWWLKGRVGLASHCPDSCWAAKFH